MTHIRETVAQAIAKVLFADGKLGDDPATSTDWLLADAAIAAIRPEVLACVPGGDVCDPQRVADDIRTLLGGWD